MISIVAHMFSKSTHATLAGVDDTLLFFFKIRRFCARDALKETWNKMLLKVYHSCTLHLRNEIKCL